MLAELNDGKPKEVNWLGSWVNYLPYVVAAHNAAPYDASGAADTGVTPFEIVTGRRYRWPQDLGFIDDPATIPPATSLHEYWQTKKEHMAAVTQWIQRVLGESRAKNADLHNLKRSFVNLLRGDQVIVRVHPRKRHLRI